VKPYMEGNAISMDNVGRLHQVVELVEVLLLQSSIVLLGCLQ